MIVDSEICRGEDGEQVRSVVRMSHRQGRMKEQADQYRVPSDLEVRSVIYPCLAAVRILRGEHRLASLQLRLLLELKNTPMPMGL